MPARKRAAAPKRKAEDNKNKDSGGKKQKPSKYLKTPNLVFTRVV